MVYGMGPTEEQKAQWSKDRVAYAVQAMLELTPTELTEAIAAIKSERCLDCGGDAGCYCMRDE